MVSTYRTNRLTAMAALALAAVFCLPAFTSAAWQEPNSAVGSIPGSYLGESKSTRDKLRFLNASIAPQQKIGTLVIGLAGDDAKLCLNSTVNATTGFPVENDAVNCRPSWAVPSGSYLSLRKLNPAVDGSVIANYTANVNSYVRIKSMGTTAEEPRTALIVSADPLSGGTTAVYAGPGIPSDDTRYAAKFSGTTYVGAVAGPSSKEFCLNRAFYPAPTVGTDPASRGCIRDWADVFFGPSGSSYLALGTNSNGTISAPLPQTGQVSITGPANTGGLIIGSSLFMDRAYTCGNGRCELDTFPGSETSANCPVDCTDTSGWSFTFNPYPGNGRVFFEALTPSTGGPWSVVVLRKAGSAPTGVPLNGVVYQTGQRVGDAYVAYAATGIANGQPFTGFSPDGGLTNGTTYHYAAFVGNGFPRYSSGNKVSAQPNVPSVTVSVQTFRTNYGTVSVSPVLGDGDFVTTRTNGSGNYTRGTKVVVWASPDANRQFCGFTSGSGNCDTASSSCEFVVDFNEWIQATFIDLWQECFIL